MSARHHFPRLRAAAFAVLSLCLAATMLLSCTPLTAESALISLRDAETFTCYYGPFTRQLAEYDIAILQAGGCTDGQVAWLNETGTRTLAYLSVGEADTLEHGDGGGPGGWASYYIGENGAPAQNADWGSYYVDAGNPAWQSDILSRAESLLAMGFSGLFLDTIGTAERYPETFPGMCSLLASLHDTYPQAILVGNCGMCARAELLPVLSGVMIEDFSSTFDFATGEYVALSGDELAYTAAQADALNALLEGRDVAVLALDYCAPGDTNKITQFAKRATEYGFLSSTSSIALDMLYPPAGQGIST